MTTKDKTIQFWIAFWRSLRDSQSISANEMFARRIANEKSFRSKWVSESALQTYLFLNLKDYFPECVELLLFERPFINNRTNHGKVDFLFLTQKEELFLIETKLIDTTDTSKTAKRRRTRHRQKVITQVLQWKSILCRLGVSYDQVRCAIFTTDFWMSSSTPRCKRNGVEAKYVSMTDLKAWFDNYPITPLAGLNRLLVKWEYP